MISCTFFPPENNLTDLNRIFPGTYTRTFQIPVLRSSHYMETLGTVIRRLREEPGWRRIREANRNKRDEGSWRGNPFGFDSPWAHCSFCPIRSLFYEARKAPSSHRRYLSPKAKPLSRAHPSPAAGNLRPFARRQTKAQLFFFFASSVPPAPF